MSKDAITSLIGDAQARVTVSLGLDDKDFGRGATGHVTVSLACNQDEGTIRDGAAVARALAEEFAVDALAAANDMYERAKTR